MSYNWASITFNEFIQIYPELSKVTEAQFDFYLALAESYIDIDYYFSSLTTARKKAIAMLVVAHLLSLAFFRQGNGGAGTINSASEGSVSVGFSGINNPNWWQQTTYGAMFWAIIRKYLTPKLIQGNTAYFGGNGTVM